jgi:hypothetical protein
LKKPAWTFRNTTLAQSGGQIVVEYVLLLVVGVSLAALITTTVVSRNPENPGFLIRKWIDLIKLVGEDTADDLKDATP